MLRSTAVVVLLTTVSGAQSPSHDFAEALALLSGDWIAEAPGATGGFSFHPDLQGKILVRRNWADYPATSDKPAYHHEDLMLVYPREDGKQLRALYLDSEYHAIEYTAEVNRDGITFTSGASAAGPRFRLSYRKAESGRLVGRFETAPPGKPDTFAIYLQWTAHRK